MGKKNTRILHVRIMGLLLMLALFACLYLVNGHKSALNSSTLATPSKDATATVTLEKRTYGIALGNGLSSLKSNQKLALLKKIRADGFTEVRYNIDWSQVELTKGKYDWAGTDAILKLVKQAGLESVITLDRTPVWARSPECKSDIFCVPNDMQAFADFSGTAAARYKTYGVLAYEIWNEPNIVNFWKPYPNPNQYAQMLVTSSAAIKKSDPKAIVLVGGLAGNSVDSNGPGYIDPRPFLNEIYAAYAGNSFDGVAYHPYTGFRSPLQPDKYNGWLKLYTGENNIRSIMSTNKDSEKLIWITEYGITSDGPRKAVTELTNSNPGNGYDHVTLEVQSEIAKTILDDMKSKPWIRNLDWYTYQDNGTAKVDAGGFYGLYDGNGKAKPILEILKRHFND